MIRVIFQYSFESCFITYYYVLTISSGALSSTLINHILGPEINQTKSHPNPIKNKHTNQKPTTYHPRNQQQKLSGYQQRMNKQNWQRHVADFATIPITQHNQFIEKNPTFLCYFSNWHFRLCLPSLLKTVSGSLSHSSPDIWVTLNYHQLMACWTHTLSIVYTDKVPRIQSRATLCVVHPLC